MSTKIKIVFVPLAALLMLGSKCSDDSSGDNIVCPSEGDPNNDWRQLRCEEDDASTKCSNTDESFDCSEGGHVTIGDISCDFTVAETIGSLHLESVSGSIGIELTGENDSCMFDMETLQCGGATSWDAEMGAENESSDLEVEGDLTIDTLKYRVIDGLISVVFSGTSAESSIPISGCFNSVAVEDD